MFFLLICLLSSVCVRFRKFFYHEHRVYSQSELERHRREGDRDDPSFRGHRQCPFCREWLFTDTEYYDHMEQNHHYCFICRHEGIFDQHFAEYSNLVYIYSCCRHALLVPIFGSFVASFFIGPYFWLFARFLT